MKDCYVMNECNQVMVLHFEEDDIFRKKRHFNIDFTMIRRECMCSLCTLTLKPDFLEIKINGEYTKLFSKLSYPEIFFMIFDESVRIRLLVFRK